MDNPLAGEVNLLAAVFITESNAQRALAAALHETDTMRAQLSEMPSKRSRISNQERAMNIAAPRAHSGYTVDERLAIAGGIIRGLLHRTDILIDALTRERMELALRIVDGERVNKL